MPAMGMGPAGMMPRLGPAYKNKYQKNHRINRKGKWYNPFTWDILEYRQWHPRKKRYGKWKKARKFKTRWDIF